MGALRLLLDTHIFLWWLEDDGKLPTRTMEAVADRSNEVLVSVASLWEILVKVRARKLDADIRRIEQRIGVEWFGRLPIEAPHLATLAALPFHHRDPFDHLLIAQAITENASLVTEDRMIRKYPVPLL